jgi:uncharacterized protein (TIGR02246 family)
MDTAPAAERFVTTWEAAWAAGDVDAIVALYAADCVHRPMPFRPAHTGRPALAAHLRAAFATEQPLSVRFSAPLVAGAGLAAAEYLVHFLESDATGDPRPTTLAGCVFVRFTPGGLAAETRDYRHTAAEEITPQGPLFLAGPAVPVPGSGARDGSGHGDGPGA